MWPIVSLYFKILHDKVPVPATFSAGLSVTIIFTINHLVNGMQGWVVIPHPRVIKNSNFVPFSTIMKKNSAAECVRVSNCTFKCTKNEPDIWRKHPKKRDLLEEQVCPWSCSCLPGGSVKAELLRFCSPSPLKLLNCRFKCVQRHLCLCGSRCSKLWAFSKYSRYNLS